MRTGTPTFTREDLQRARQAWADGEFSDEWRDVRHQAAMRGMIYPPAGSQWDSWEDDSPSQRAILIRAIRETPELLRRCIDRASSWDGVIALLIAGRDDMREDAGHRERDVEAERHDRPEHPEAAMALGRILERIATSRGLEP